MKKTFWSKFGLTLVLLVTTLQQSDAGCPSKEWIEYKEEKCIRVLDLLSNHPSAELTCQEKNSTLLSINSAEEQEFFNQLLFSDLEILDNVWLGAVRVNSTTFQWTDGSPWTFDNWKEGSPSNTEGNGCAQMVPQDNRKDNFNFIEESSSGLWSDVACGRRNLVVCQRRPTFSLDELTALVFQNRQSSEALIKNLRVELEEANIKNLQLRQDVEELEKNPVPLGFVYTQLGGQPDPSVIWPTVEWTQVTQDYAGLFFRAEGGNSSTFGQVQNDQSPRLSRVVTAVRKDVEWSPSDISVPERGASEWLFAGANDVTPGIGDFIRFFLSFHNSGGEVRPRNQAIRLWKRTA